MARRSGLDTLARTAALLARTTRDVQAVERGTFPRRYARRQVRRRITGPLADMLWRSIR
jgi:hypothetical protein